MQERQERGVFYTPGPLIEHLLDTALEPTIAEALAASPDDREGAILGIKVCDPSCGGGHFLLAAARRLAGHLVRVRGGACAHRCAIAEVVSSCIYGVDIDPGAADVCRAALLMESQEACATDVLKEHVACGNALLWTESRKDGFHWESRFPQALGGATRRGFDVIVGNPPYLNQLESATAASRRLAEVMSAWSGGAVRGYADAAAAFLLLSIRLTRPGGRVALVLPQSLLSVKDAGAVRREAAEACTLESLWVAGCHVFPGASVYTCAPTLRVGEAREGALTRFAAHPPARVDAIPIDMNRLAAEPTWSHLDPNARDVPQILVRSSATVGDIAVATADFRDQYYGLDGFLVDSVEGDDAAFPPLVTTGLIDPATCHWGKTTTRVLKQRWAAPRVDRAKMLEGGSLATWMEARLVPKILLATQTRVLEVFVDDAGRFLPCVPLITITPRDPAKLWHLAAALSSPVLSAIAFRTFSGAALSANAIKLAAKQVMTLPIPGQGPRWDVAAMAMERAARSDDASRPAALAAMGRAMIDAFDIEDHGTLFEWWWRRLTPRVGQGATSRRSAMSIRSRRITRPKISVGHSML